MKRFLLWSAVTVFVLVVGIFAGGMLLGISPREMKDLATAVYESRSEKKSVPQRLEEIERKHPDILQLASAVRGGLTILVFKQERKVEVMGKGWAAPVVYGMKGFSGMLGPKLREGDGQIPEGFYGVEYLNPNSLFHLSLKVSYPNDFDKTKAAAEGRTELGNDIMIHGGSATVGCIPIGDENIEQVFYFAAKAGKENVKIVIAPYDMRSGRKPELEKSDIPWYPELCDAIYRELTAE